MGIIAAQRLQAESDRQDRMLNAEDLAVRNAMGMNCSNNSPTDQAGEMGHTILGDVQYPTPIVINGQQKSAMGPILAAILGAAIPGAGVAGAAVHYLLSDRQPTIQDTDTDTSVELGLKKLNEVIPPE